MAHTSYTRTTVKKRKRGSTKAESVNKDGFWKFYYDTSQLGKRESYNNSDLAYGNTSMRMVN